MILAALAALIIYDDGHTSVITHLTAAQCKEIRCTAMYDSSCKEHEQHYASLLHAEKQYRINEARATSAWEKTGTPQCVGTKDEQACIGVLMGATHDPQNRVQYDQDRIVEARCVP